MLWAQIGRNENDPLVVIAATLLSGVFCGGIPLGTGLAMRQSVLGVIGGVISGAVGALGGCCLGFPVTLLFTIVIVVVGLVVPTVSASRRPAPYADEVEYDEYARPFQLPGSKHDEPPSGMSERDRARRHQEKYGFRPRRRPAVNPDPEDDI